MMRMQSPKQADVWLDFEPGVIVMLQLRAQRQPKPVRDEVDLILYECVVEVVAAAARIKGEGKAAGGSIGGNAGPDSPQDIVPVADGEVMVEVEVDRMADSAKQYVSAIGPVVVHLQGRVGSVRERVVPAPQQVPSHQVGAVVEGAGRRWRQGNHPRHRYTCTPVVEVALHGKRVLVRHFPIRPESPPENIPAIQSLLAGGTRKCIPIEILGEEPVMRTVINLFA